MGDNQDESGDNSAAQNAAGEGMSVAGLAAMFAKPERKRDESAKAGPNAGGDDDAENVDGSAAADEGRSGETDAGPETTQESADEFAQSDDDKKFFEHTPPEIQAAFRKRLGKYAAKARSAAAETAQVQQQIEALRQQALQMQKNYETQLKEHRKNPSTVSDLVAESGDEASLSKLESEMDDHIARFEDNQRRITRALDAMENELGDGSVEIGGKTYNAQQLEDAYKLARRIRDKEIPYKRSTLKESQTRREQAMAMGRQFYPEVFDQKTDQYRTAVQLMNQFPELAKSDNAYGLVPLLVRGLEETRRINQANQSRQPKDGDESAERPNGAKPKIAPRLGDEGARAPSRLSDGNASARKKLAQDARRNFEKSGTVSDLAEYFKRSVD